MERLRSRKNFIPILIYIPYLRNLHRSANADAERKPKSEQALMESLHSCASQSVHALKSWVNCFSRLGHLELLQQTVDAQGGDDGPGCHGWNRIYLV